MSFEQPQADRESRDEALQQIVDAVVETGAGRPEDDLARDLERRIRQHGLPAMPPTWVHAVAAQAAVGNPYVVSRLTAEHNAIPEPEDPDPPFGIG